MLLLRCKQQGSHTCHCVLVDLGRPCQQFLNHIFVLSLRLNGVHERGLLFLVFVVDQSILVEQRLNELEVALLAGHHQRRPSMVGLFRVDVRPMIHHDRDALYGLT